MCASFRENNITILLGLTKVLGIEKYNIIIKSKTYMYPALNIFILPLSLVERDENTAVYVTFYCAGGDQISNIIYK